MRKLNVILLTAMAAAGILASRLVRRHAAAALRQNDAALLRQQEQIAILIAENQGGPNLAVQTKERGVNNTRVANVSTELAKLRARAASLESQANQLSNQLWQSRVAAGARLLSSLHSNLLDHNQEIWGPLGDGPAARTKFSDARAYTIALRRYADEHQGVFPLKLDQVAPYLPKPLDSNSPSWAMAPVSGTNDFEIVYQGTASELANIPHIALIRETQPWPTPDGKWAKVYGYTDGDVFTVESDDNFQSWDAQHIVPPSAAQ